MISLLRRGLLVILAAALPIVANAAPGQSAHDIVSDTTTRLLADLSANKELYKTNPSKFYDALNGIVGPVVDVDGISKSIMTVKYSRNATPAQMAMPCLSSRTKALPFRLPRMKVAIVPASI